MKCSSLRKVERRDRSKEAERIRSAWSGKVWCGYVWRGGLVYCEETLEDLLELPPLHVSDCFTTEHPTCRSDSLPCTNWRYNPLSNWNTDAPHKSGVNLSHFKVENSKSFRHRWLTRWMRWTHRVARMGPMSSAFNILFGKYEGKRPLGRPRRRWEDNTRINLR
jgi:hypothetical protein